MTLTTITSQLIEEISGLRFAEPVTHVYNPLVYARASHQQYLDRFGQGRREVLLLGMNPGPFGMAQTGIPFGEVAIVRDWMGINAPVDKPDAENPKRPVQGFDCPRSEVSGRRLWGWARDKYGAPENFFARFFVINFCPLCFMEEGGRNRTPDKLPAEESKPLIAACQRALRDMVTTLQPEHVIGVGQFAEKQAKTALDGIDTRIGRILHPSPASPLANRGWAEAAVKDFAKLGIAL
jgi:single-strand selective monofunctional uracil DNA glycosylase